MTGWTLEAITANGLVQVNEWECVNSTLFASDGYLVMKATQPVELLAFNFVTLYRCVQMTAITDQSYRYYQLDPAQAEEIGYDRVTVATYGPLTNATVLCDIDNGASGQEYQVMIVKGNETAAKVRCPYEFLGLYDYTHTSSTTTTCQTTSDTWDMCSDATQITVDYGTCPTKVAYSEADTVWCVDNVHVDTTNFAMLYNYLDATIDESTTYRFSCLAVNADNTQASISPRHCQENQDPTSQPRDATTAAIGATLTFTLTSSSCPPCTELTSPTQGSVTVHTEGATTVATYTCDPGNSLFGSPTRECLATGVWDPPDDPSCTCPAPTTPDNGTATMVFGVNVTTVTYTCDVGYVLVGNAERTCLSDINTWTGTDPTCDECQALTTPVSGSLSIVSIGVTSLASFTCNEMFSMDGVSEGYCLNDTSWNSTEPTCTSCQSLATFFSGSVFPNTSGTITTVYHTCAADYSLVGSNPLNCLSTGAWDNSQPTCVCNDPVVPDNGTMVVSNANTTVTYTCDLYFTMDGSNTRTCLRDGTGWNGVDPICVECLEKTDPTNGNVAVTTNGIVSSASYRCALNYAMDGESETQCQTSGNWLVLDPVCNECGIVYEPTGGSISTSTDGIMTSAVFQCEVGRTIDGEPEPYCQSNGTWTDNAAARTCALCQTVTDVEQGSHTMATNGTHTSATFSCTSGYKLTGAETASCDSSGQWEVLDQACEKESSSSDFPFMPVAIVLGCLGLVLIVVAAVSISCNLKWHKKLTVEQQADTGPKGPKGVSLKNIVNAPPMNQRLRKIRVSPVNQTITTENTVET